MKNAAVWSIFANDPTIGFPKGWGKNTDNTIYFAYKTLYFMSVASITKHGNDSMLPTLVYSDKFMKTL